MRISLYGRGTGSAVEVDGQRGYVKRIEASCVWVVFPYRGEIGVSHEDVFWL